MAGKGDKNRVRKFKKYQDNYDKIDWSKGEEKPILYRQETILLDSKGKLKVNPKWTR